MAENKKYKSAKIIEDDNLNEVNGGGKDIWIIRQRCSVCGAMMGFNDAEEWSCLNPDCQTNYVVNLENDDDFKVI